MEETEMIRYVEENDKEFWYRFDRHLSETEFEKKVRDRMGYIMVENTVSVGILRYQLFWDNIPFLTLLFIDWEWQRKGYGRKLLEYWEEEMKQLGYGMVMVSTQVDEEAQYFYRKLGYQDRGSLIIDVAGYEQPMELFLIKKL